MILTPHFAVCLLVKVSGSVLIRRADMQLDAIRSGVHLRSTAHLSKDRSAPRVTADHERTERDAHAHETYYLDLGMDRWLPHVRDLTFETTSVSISAEEAKLLRAAYAHLHGRTYYEDTSLPTSECLPADILAALTELGQRLWPAMKALGAASSSPSGVGGVFGKLSGRSAKDSPLYTKRLGAALAAQLDASNASTDDSDNTALHRLFEAALALMRLNDPAALLWMLINSQRVDEDLDVALRHPERWDQAVVLRRWWDGVATDLEFRMFVVDGRPTGLTQYNQMVHSPRIAQRGESIAQAMCAYYEAEVLPRLRSTPFYEAVGGRFTCDLALHPDALDLLVPSGGDGGPPPPPIKLGMDLIKLVELNCFYEATGMGLFDYHADYERLTNGPFECRVRAEPMPNAAVKIENEWRDVLRSMGKASPGTVSTRRFTDEAWRQLAQAQSLP